MIDVPFLPKKVKIMKNKLTKEKWCFKILEGLDTLVEERRDSCWGSRQYQTAHGFYMLFNDIRRELSLKDTLNVLGIQFNFEKHVDFKVAKQTIIDNIEEEIRDISREYNQDDYIHDWKQQQLYNIKKANCADDLFYAYRDSASDLWTTAPIILNAFFHGFDLKNIHKSPGKGPIMNIIVQEENYTTGLYCALLVDHGHIIDDACFNWVRYMIDSREPNELIKE